MQSTVQPQALPKAAILQVDTQFLAGLLQLPEGARIDLVMPCIDNPERLQIRVLGAGWPVAEGARIREAFGTVHAPAGGQFEVAPRIDWGFPAE